MKLGPLNFLAHYTYAREQVSAGRRRPNGAPARKRGGGRDTDRAPEVAGADAGLRPGSSSAGVFRDGAGGGPAAAEKQIQRAIQLEPENQSYLLSLAQVQLARRDPAAARRTLEPLRLPNVQPEVRAHAEEMLKALKEGT